MRSSAKSLVLLAFAFFCLVATALAGCSLDDTVVGVSIDGGPGGNVIDGQPTIVDGGPGDANAPTDGGVSVTIVGSTSPLTAQEKRDLAALVTGTSDTAVTWSVDAPITDGGVDAGDGGAETSPISAGGTFTAPTTPGTYTIVATSHADASVRATVSIDVVAAPVAVLTAPDLATASATGLTASVPAQVGAAFAWTVTNGTITAGTGTNAITFTAGASGAMAVTCVVTNAAGTIAVGTANVAIVSSPVVAISAPSAVTTGKTGVVASVPSQATATYAWTITGGAITAGNGTSAITFTAGGVGTLTLGCTITVGTTAVTGSNDVSVVAAPDATLTAPSGAATGATGLAASVPVQSGATFAWAVTGGTITAGSGTSSITFTATSPGTLVVSVTVSNAAGDSASASANVVVTSAPTTPTISAPSQATAGATGLLASTPVQAGATYAWTITGGTITSATNGNAIVFTAGAAPGPVALGVTVTNPAGSANGNANVTVVAAPTTASLQVALSGNPVNAVVDVSGPSGYASTINASQTLTGLAPGVYTVTAANAISGGLTYVPTVTGSPVTLSAGDVGNVTVTWTSHDDPPTIGAVSDQTLTAGSAAVDVPFTVSDTEDDPATLTVTATFTGSAISSFTLGGSGANRIITLTPAATAASDTDVTLTVTDSQGMQGTRTFHVTTQ